MKVLIILLYCLLAITNQNEVHTIQSKQYTSAPKIIEQKHIEKQVDKDELYLLAHIIYSESGSNWCSDNMQLYVGSVVLNRVKSNRFPNTIQEVIFQKGQYQPTWSGSFYLEPNQRAWDNAEKLLLEGSVLPDNVLFQAQFKQGKGVYIKEQNMYFCY